MVKVGRGEGDRLGTTVGRLDLSNPVMPASGCFGPELAAVAPVQRLAAVVTKTVFATVRSGNPAHRLAETPGGMLNSVGIPSVGAERWRAETWPAYAECGPPVVVSVGGLAEREYVSTVRALADLPAAAFELNLSCPNLEAAGLELGSDPNAVQRVVTGVREVVRQPLWAKLTPNVGSVAGLAAAAAAGGADAVVVANTYAGMAIDIHARRAALGNTTGGWSGPASRPLVLRHVWETARTVDVPVIGCGGVAGARDVVEYLLAGACAVQVGTATFARPQAMTDIVADLPAVLDDVGASTIRELVGGLDLAAVG